MPRPRKRRMVDRAPLYTGFRPVGGRRAAGEEVRLFWEELEALRLKDLERLDQAQAAERMGVSRPTFQRILRAARSKVAQALVDGLGLRVDGGTFELPTAPPALPAVRPRVAGASRRRSRGSCTGLPGLRPRGH